MNFVEGRFVVFFLGVWALAWWLRPGRGRKALLLVASYLFYAAWDWRFLSLIWISTAVDFWVGGRLAGEARPDRRRQLLLVSLATNLGILGLFKYLGFFVDSALAGLAVLGVDVVPVDLALVLPVGISFYSFQTLSYTMDVYRGTLRPCRSPLDFALFVAFFPQLVAGPIVRAADFLPQLDERPRLGQVRVRAAAMLFLVGFFKKACVSDNLAPTVDLYFADPSLFTAGAARLASALYAAQIYCDFSGYSDMAIACAALLGYRLPRNFDHPYLAADPSSFWRRWHISLSSWLRDYLYISLGGNRGGRWATYRNLMLTMLLGGLWHGAGWTFVLWGALHGVALVAHRLWRERQGARPGLPLPVAWLLTQLLVVLAWIPFRAEDLGDALTVAGAACLGVGAGGRSLPWSWAPVLAALLGLHALVRGRDPTRTAERLPVPVFWFLFGLAVGVCLLAHPVDVRPFVYFQF